MKKRLGLLFVAGLVALLIATIHLMGFAAARYGRLIYRNQCAAGCSSSVNQITHCWQQ